MHQRVIRNRQELLLFLALELEDEDQDATEISDHFGFHVTLRASVVKRYIETISPYAGSEPAMALAGKLLAYILDPSECKKDTLKAAREDYLEHALLCRSH